MLIENRHGLVVAACATQATTTAEREAALRLLDQYGGSSEQVNASTPPITLGADKSYQDAKFLAELRRRQVVPHVAEYRDNPYWHNALSEGDRQHPAADEVARSTQGGLVLPPAGQSANLVRMVKLIPAV